MSESRFERRRSTSQYWYNKASDLMGAAAVIRFTSSDEKAAGKIVADANLGSGFNLSVATYRVFHMLCGMALELIYKAILVEDGKEPPANHSLSTLANLAGLDLSPEDESLLKIWSQLVIWDGKYPVPKKEEHMKTYEDLIDRTLWNPVEGTPFKQMNDGIEWSGFRIFWNKACERYFAVCNRE